MHCMNRPEPIGVVLAGGRSTRMGRDKADVEWRCGQTLLERAIERADDAGCERVIVSGDRPTHDHVVDHRPGAGPLGGLASVLAERAKTLTGRLLLVLPLDMPMLETATLRRLLAAGETAAAGAVFPNGPLPMVLRCTPELRAIVDDVMASGRKRSLGELARALDLDVAGPAPADEMANANRQSELAVLRRRATAS
jgi:molybdopterin-guanine dinucleotide biosynthesis protein A